MAGDFSTSGLNDGVNKGGQHDGIKVWDGSFNKQGSNGANR
jgi:hypothetical protein